MAELYADPDKPFTGRVTAFFGSKGGVGSSTMAHNIAWMLATRHNQETALVDLDASWGTTGLDFNYDNVQGLEEALAAPDRLDETLLDRIMLRHTETLSLLPAAASLNNVGSDSSEAFEAVVEGIRKISPLSILDLPHYWTDWTSKTLIGADDIVITATPDLANLRNTKNLVDFLRANRPNDADPLLILNKTNVPKTPEIPVKDFATALGLEPTLVLPYEPVLYAQAANDGKMLSDMKSDSKAVNGFAYIGQRLRTGNFDSVGVKSGKGRSAKGASLLSKFKKKK
jgi:pilus assembly protein CpaE